MIFPRNEIFDEETALDWWEQTFAPNCEAMGAQVNAAVLVRILVGSLREIRNASLDVPLSLSAAANETGYSAKQVGRWVKTGKVLNVGSATIPRVRRGDILSYRKPQDLPSVERPNMVPTAQDIARSVVNSRKR